MTNLEMLLAKAEEFAAHWQEQDEGPTARLLLALAAELKSPAVEPSPDPGSAGTELRHPLLDRPLPHPDWRSGKSGDAAIPACPNCGPDGPLGNL